MAKMRVSFDLDVAPGILIYDIAAKRMECRVCQVWRQLDFSPQGPDSGFCSNACDLPMHQIFENFAGSHTACVVRHNEEQRQREAQINATRGGPGDR